MFNKIYGVLWVLLVSISMAEADVKLASIFCDNIVLQQEKPIKIWGWADPGERVTVALDNQSQIVLAGDDGRWSVKFPPKKASFCPLTLTVEGKNKITRNNILIGEVWICSGQSNMVFALNHSVNGQQECAEAIANSDKIRMFTVTKNLSLTPKDNFEPLLMQCSKPSIVWFSAVGYFFGRELYKALNVPIGLISSNFGGTAVEAWTPLEYLETVKSMRQRLDAKKDLYNPKALEKLVQEYQEKQKQYNEGVAKAVEEGENQKTAVDYSAVDFNDSEWKTISIPDELLECLQLKNYDGYVWFRKTIDIPAEWAGKDLTLWLGPMINMINVIWFDNQEVARYGSVVPQVIDFWNQPKMCTIPGKLVKVGKNVITVRMVKKGLFSTKKGEMLIKPDQTADKGISLVGEWRYLSTVPLPTNRPIDPINWGICSSLYNSMINPMAGFAVRGVIWYQGETNVDRAYQYRELMPLMIKAWRDKWSDDKIIFIQTQLANYLRRASQPQESYWAELREAQFMTAQKDPLGGMAVTIDIGEDDNIHPRNKQDVGKRLCLQALKVAYGRNLAFEGPVYNSMKVEGNKVRITFTSVFGGLVAKGRKLKGFAIAGKDTKFVWADAEIDGKDVIVWSDKISEPQAVRYGWADNPECTLYNTAGLPALPFRTDDWKGLSADRK